MYTLLNFWLEIVNQTYHETKDVNSSHIIIYEILGKVRN